ncbi:MAG TPA: YbaK/EbsC family protein [Deltaproteobacteria bacterium]|nr:MAG: cys-tRNA(pro)/cys-tRNA(cys) deacylase [bacterium]HDH10461.1 YbaK/EbsC family protein [Deltaproteobacteria bacterium]
MKSSIERVIDSFKKFGIKNSIIRFEQDAGTAQDAAVAVGCTLSRIAKSIVFKTKDGHPVLVVASGANRIDKNRVSEVYGTKLKISSPEFAKQTTGFSVGEVTPFGLISEIPVFVDESLFIFEKIWISAGAGNMLAEIDPHDLLILPLSRKVEIVKR